MNFHNTAFERRHIPETVYLLNKEKVIRMTGFIVRKKYNFWQRQSYEWMRWF